MAYSDESDVGGHKACRRLHHLLHLVGNWFMNVNVVGCRRWVLFQITILVYYTYTYTVSKQDETSMVWTRPPLTLTFDHLTLKLVCESRLRWGTFLPNLGTLSLWVLELFVMHATDEQTDGQTKAMLIAAFPAVGDCRFSISFSCLMDIRFIHY